MQSDGFSTKCHIKNGGRNEVGPSSPSNVLETNRILFTFRWQWLFLARMGPRPHFRGCKPNTTASTNCASINWRFCLGMLGWIGHSNQNISQHHPTPSIVHWCIECQTRLACRIAGCRWSGSKCKRLKLERWICLCCSGAVSRRLFK